MKRTKFYIVGNLSTHYWILLFSLWKCLFTYHPIPNDFLCKVIVHVNTISFFTPNVFYSSLYLFTKIYIKLIRFSFTWINTCCIQNYIKMTIEMRSIFHVPPLFSKVTKVRLHIDLKKNPKTNNFPLKQHQTKQNL